MRLIFFILISAFFLQAQVVIAPRKQWSTAAAGEDWVIRWLANNRTIELTATGDTALTEHNSPNLTGDATSHVEGDSAYGVGAENDYFSMDLAAGDVLEDSGAIEFYLKVSDRLEDGRVCILWDQDDEYASVFWGAGELSLDVVVGGESGNYDFQHIFVNNRWDWYRFWWKNDSVGCDTNGVRVGANAATGSFSPTDQWDQIRIGDLLNSADDSTYIDALYIFDDPNETVPLSAPDN